MIVEPLEPRHLATLELQPAQAYLAGELTADLARQLAAAGPAHAAVHGGRTIAAAGVMLDCWALPTAWAMISTAPLHRLVPIHRAVLRGLQALRGPVQTGVEPGHEDGERWARLLGFAPVDPWRDWRSAYGKSFVRWVRHGA